MRRIWLIPLLLLAACSAPPAPSPPPGPDRWTERAAAPHARTEVSAATLGNRIWVLGGMDDDGRPAPDVMIYDPAADRWSTGPALPEGVHHAAAAGDGSRLWIAGGYVDSGSGHQPTAAVRMIDSATGTWSDGPPLPSPRGAGALAWDGSRLVFAGGVGPSSLSGDVFALENGSWRTLGRLTTAREHLAAASDGSGSTYFLAGRLGGLDTNRPDVDLVTGAVVTRIGAVPTARGGVAGFYSPTHGACVAGGEQPSGTFTQVECIRSDATTTTLPPLTTPRHGLGAVYLDGTAYALLGGPNPGLTVSPTIQALRPTTP
ncbi:MAG TPA: hypothetical protein VFV67_16430 [Actinophytocola sp.]|uniref:Kelch repeat-containing protein n=1 Tax=Actinophytocola sp. TaxID=1872138 RepID=UPI002DB7DBCE|nr:hypothetical protein [Actinophytocola sp.]HEU5472242.1 hypothetical protein [Actinophytocola sp.]